MNFDLDFSVRSLRKCAVFLAICGSLSLGNSTGLAQPCTTGPYWVQLHPALSPPGRQFHAMAYDNSRQKIILFGGYDTNGIYLGDTWQFDVQGWKRLSPAHDPPARSQHSLSYDASRNAIILFGGHDDAASFNDTWEWNGADWSQIFPANSPSPRFGHGMAYDSVRQTHVLFGGTTFGGQEFGDTWEYDGNLGAWTLRATNGPAPRYGIQLVYDVPRNRTLLFGGYTGAGATEDDHYLNDTWYWTSGPSGSWAQQTPERVPFGRVFYSAAYYNSRGFVLVQNGQIASSREGTIGLIDLAQAWTGLAWVDWDDFQFPRRTRGGAMVYDAARDRMIYFGGFAYSFDDDSVIFDGTWSLEGRRWHYQEIVRVDWEYATGQFPGIYHTVQEGVAAAHDCADIDIRVGDYNETRSGAFPLVITKAVRLGTFRRDDASSTVRIH
jgi:hypothetical protein